MLWWFRGDCQLCCKFKIGVDSAVWQAKVGGKLEQSTAYRPCTGCIRNLFSSTPFSALHCHHS